METTAIAPVIQWAVGQGVFGVVWWLTWQMLGAVQTRELARVEAYAQQQRADKAEYADIIKADERRLAALEGKIDRMVQLLEAMRGNRNAGD